MKKYLMTIQFAVVAEDSNQAWYISEVVIGKHLLRGLGNTISAHELTLEEAEDTIAVNEPLKATRVLK